MIYCESYPFFFCSKAPPAYSVE